MTIEMVPWGGLCNRMRAVATAWCHAQRAGQPLVVGWYKTSDFNSEFGRIFETTGLPWTVRERDALGRGQKIAMRVRESVLALQGHKMYMPLATREDHFEPDEFRAVASQRHVYLRTHSPLRGCTPDYSAFRPRGPAAANLQSLRAHFEGAIGVHIRRSDNAKSIEMSPLTAFEALMHDEIARDPAARFFVASDSQADVDELRRQFGGRISVYEKRSYDRADPRAIEDAVVDLYALAGCKRLIGSYWSSFTDTAQAIGGIPCVIAGQQQQREAA